MVFSRFFGKPEDEQGGDLQSDQETQDVGVEADESTPEDADAELERAHDWAGRARRSLVGGASTGSKRVASLYGTETDIATHYVRAAGCHLVTTDGRTLVDCTMALGSVALGYAEPQLTRAVVEALANGSVSGLSPALEVELAERFCAAVPCAERVQFLKSGADAMSAAVRIARAYTGRDRVVGCGYFGWHDWSSDSAGVPAITRALYAPVPFDDVAALEHAVANAGDALAAVVIEPVIERLPSKEWVARARSLCDARGAVLIFDEIKTGFRIATGGYQQYGDIVPDLAAFGKAMANGYPLSAVCGNAALMDAAEGTWISSTLASETGALTAALAVLSWHDRVEVCDSLWSIGKEIREVVQQAITASDIPGVTQDGIDPMWFLRFEDPAMESAFLTAAVQNGVLFKRGPYNFAALAHDDEAIREIEAAASAALVEVRDSSSE